MRLKGKNHPAVDFELAEGDGDYERLVVAVPSVIDRISRLP